MSHSPSQVSRRRLISLPALPLFLCYLFPLPHTHAFIYIMHIHIHTWSNSGREGVDWRYSFFFVFTWLFCLFPHFFHLFPPFSTFFLLRGCRLAFFFCSTEWKEEGRKKLNPWRVIEAHPFRIMRWLMGKGGGLHGWLAAVWYHTRWYRNWLPPTDPTMTGGIPWLR